MESTTALDHTESSIRYQSATWDLDPRQTALILVDIWDTHIVRSHMERARQIVRDGILPVLDAARKAGITAIHAPSAAVAARHSPDRWADGLERVSAPPRTAVRGLRGVLSGIRSRSGRWPPASFRDRTGPYAIYARTPPSMWPGPKPPRDIPDSVRPLPGEPVIASGAQLHRLLRARRVLHLFYAGFATNVCVKDVHDYSMRTMHRRGYNLILLRDCTTGIENAETVDELLLTRLAILELEQSCASATAEAFLEGCARLCR